MAEQALRQIHVQWIANKCVEVDSNAVNTRSAQARRRPIDPAFWRLGKVLRIENWVVRQFPIAVVTTSHRL